MRIKELQNEILKLKKSNDFTILAHYYQPIEIQEIADFLGDSLGLSKLAKEKANTEYIIFAGVDFMAETASILNQDKHVLIPHPESCCPMAAFLTPEMVRDFKKEYPGLPSIVYVNSTAAVKAEADVCCTSSNAVKIVEKIREEYKSNAVLFGPDANLADYAEQVSHIKTIKMPEEGHCYVHSQITPEDIDKIRKKYPNAYLLVHPECKRNVREMADLVGSTAQMYNYVKKLRSDSAKFLIGTEIGLLERMQVDFPQHNFTIVNDKLICYNMKKHNLELIKHLFEHPDDKNHEVKVPTEIANKAINSIEKMLSYS